MDPNEPNPLNWPIVSDGGKMGFCLMDYGTCGTGPNSTYYGHCRDENRYSPDYLEYFPEFDDGTNGGTIKLNEDYPNFGLGGGEYGCSPIEQGISAGWLDLYGEWLDEQWINLEPGLCNGMYWIIGEVDRNNDYLESNEDNNWTAVQVELTQQVNGEYDIQIVTDQEGNPNICNGEILTLSASSNSNENTYEWSTGDTTPTIDVTESGDYTLTSTNICGVSESTINVTVSNPEIPTSQNVTIESGENAILNATGTGTIIWSDTEGNILYEGADFITEPLFENTTFYVTNEEVIIEAPTELATGATDHEGESFYSSGVYNGGLVFDAYEEFTLNSVKVYTEYEGDRLFELLDNDGNLVESSLINIPVTSNNGYVVNLNWFIPAGSQYTITTNIDTNNENFDINSPRLRRTTENLPEYPYLIDNIVEISQGMYDDGTVPGYSTLYYYYFYDWKISNDWNIGSVSCESPSAEVIVEICNDTDNDNVCYNVDNCPDTYNPNQDDFDNDGVGDACDGLTISEDQSYFTIFPNPASEFLNITFNNKSVGLKLKVYNGLGEIVRNINIESASNNETISIETNEIPSGLYFIEILNKDTSTIKTFTISR